MFPVPADVEKQLQPCPDDFRPEFLTVPKKGAVRWGTTLYLEPDRTPIQVELGFSIKAHKDDMDTAHSNLRAQAWRVMECVRLGRPDLVAFARVDRHSGSRTISTPQFVPQEE